MTGILSLGPQPLAFSPAVAKEKPGTAALPVLEVPAGARVAVLGPGAAAVVDDLYALQLNPAGLSFLERREATFLYLKGVEDTGLQFVGYGQGLAMGGVLNFGSPAFAAGLLYSQNGTIEVNRTNPDGSFLDSRSLRAGTDLVASLGYAEHLGEQRLEGGQTVEYVGGVAASFIHSTLAEKYSADTVAAGAGFMARLDDPGIALGLSVANFGPPVRYLGADDPLPIVYRAAAAYTLRTLWDQTLLLAGGVEYSGITAEPRPALGLEWSAKRLLALRLGYQFRTGDAVGLSAGFGLAERNFEMNYAWVPFDALSDQHRVTLTWRFGDAPKERKARRVIQDLDRPPLEPRRQKPKTPPSGLIVPGWE